jgi:DNA invertase Pin-like site-specific DNA recombinase
MKSVCYVRVSTDIQEYDRQIEDIRKYCNEANLELVKEFSEKESGKIKIRPALTEMIEFIKLNEVDFVVISELSRLGRTSKVLETIEFLN